MIEERPIAALDDECCVGNAVTVTRRIESNSLRGGEVMVFRW